MKDRDISGELKDVWNAVQAQRDRERGEQMLLQRQQHFHNLTNASANGRPTSNSSPILSNNAIAGVASTTHQMASSDKAIMSNESVSKTAAESTQPRNRKNIPEVQKDISSNIDLESDMETKKINNGQISLSLLAEQLNSKISVSDSETGEECSARTQSNTNNQNNDALNNEQNSKDSLETEKSGRRDYQADANCKKDFQKEQHTNGFILNSRNKEVLNSPKFLDAATSNPAQTPATTASPLCTAPTKKEKLGGFLPNGCIFPRFTKNNKHKDKDKDKEPKSKDKEKNPILSALKKSKDKKSNSTAANSDEKFTSSSRKLTAANCSNPNSKLQKNCLQTLECGKLDLNNHHHLQIDENNINKTVSSLANDTSETNKKPSSTITNCDGVGVH